MNRQISVLKGWAIRRGPIKIMAYLLLFFVAFGLKYHYSYATAEDLAWVLKPTAALVMNLSDLTFIQEAHTGFVSREGRIIIAPSCAGINFMIIALLMAGGMGISRLKTGWIIPAWVGLTGICVYVLTIVVNTIRIAGSIYLYSADIYNGWLTPTRAHRLEGIVVYFLALCLFHLAVQHILTVYIRRMSTPTCKQTGIRPPLTGWAPAAWYFLVLLGVPLANRAVYHYPVRFLEHSLTIILGSALVLFVLFLIRSAGRQVIGRSRRVATSRIAKNRERNIYHFLPAKGK